MVEYLLDSHENITFSKTLSDYQEQPHPLLYFLIHLKNACSENLSWKCSASFPRTYICPVGRLPWKYWIFKDIQRISGTVLSSKKKTTAVFLDPPKKACNIGRIFMEELENTSIFNIPGTLFWNIPRNFIGNFSLNILEKSQGNVPRIFHEHIFAWWEKS